MTIGRLFSLMCGILVLAAAASAAQGPAVPSLQWSITEIHAFEPGTRLKGEAVIVFNNALEVRCAIAGRRVLWPARRAADGSWIPQTTVVDGELRGRIDRAVLARFDRLLSESGRPTEVER